MIIISYVEFDQKMIIADSLKIKHLQFFPYIEEFQILSIISRDAKIYLF